MIGDKLDSEIYYGNKLGMITIRKNGGTYGSCTPQNELEKPTYDIMNISEVLKCK